MTTQNVTDEALRQYRKAAARHRHEALIAHVTQHPAERERHQRLAERIERAIRFEQRNPEPQ